MWLNRLVPQTLTSIRLSSVDPYTNMQLKKIYMLKIEMYNDFVNDNQTPELVTWSSDTVANYDLKGQIYL